ncbi:MULTISPECIES: entericidin A/B family lipoprotein [Symbiopectobacterium]|uniref:Entericidin A/B family lipoprotein n=1 Tax=Symbiopectobacterium purcellii TaxID=2871826 RepID=A0ABX9AP29_9ENTR|nr:MULTISPECIES: entericidin A/B family lipoprotein [Symbiopectobacterium]MCW2477327.1 entericidin A/B family lipoprotein [Candidatus Symbiopectobacterium sp. NZEC151]MCW2477998.1 entericidin A/B family lipoprotein [Candidatus Symbiopectobacterium sp. NZEC135]MCW2482358.1 entericidin A/B family lipoprotein [Candidatus Symbiopectobacterium sp. NZEC135]MCW2486915.1 entericidin A/B family lipoprotein [Candidatus Symbiopectobacterium sp. NZEC127]QZN96777.1 entericidin A/B family lipoprotein [Symbi
MFKKSVLILASLLMLSALTACNTTRGIGQDVEAGGKAIQRSAQ